MSARSSGQSLSHNESTSRESAASEEWQGWETTLDGMFMKRVQLLQHRKGYRFSIDSVLLSHFAAQGPVGPTADLGCGCGVVLLLLADLWRQQKLHPTMCGIELQGSLAELARVNVKQNGFAAQIEILQHDLREALPTGRWKVITFNPPYRPPENGRVSKHPQRASARHEMNGSLEQMISTAAARLHAQGRFCFVYPAVDTIRLIEAVRLAGLHVVRLRCVHPYKDEDAKLLLLEASRRVSPLKIERPLTLYLEHREYTEEAAAILAGHAPHIVESSP